MPTYNIFDGMVVFFYSLLSLLVFGWTTNVKYVQHMKTVRWLLLVGKNDFIGKIYYVRVNLLDVRQLKFAYFTWWWLRQIMYCLVHFFPFILLNDLWVVSISYIFNLKRSHEKENEIRRIYMYAINSNREHFLFFYLDAQPRTNSDAVYWALHTMYAIISGKSS